jgi:hypothetical protein
LAARGEVDVVHIGRRALVTDDSLKAFVQRLRGGRTTGVPTGIATEYDFEAALQAARDDGDLSAANVARHLSGAE